MSVGVKMKVVEYSSKSLALARRRVAQKRQCMREYEKVKNNKYLLLTDFCNP
jgi:hypothetical protein